MATTAGHPGALPRMPLSRIRAEHGGSGNSHQACPRHGDCGIPRRVGPGRGFQSAGSMARQYGGAGRVQPRRSVATGVPTIGVEQVRPTQVRPNTEGRDDGPVSIYDGMLTACPLDWRRWSRRAARAEPGRPCPQWNTCSPCSRGTVRTIERRLPGAESGGSVLGTAVLVCGGHDGRDQPRPGSWRGAPPVRRSAL